MSEVKGFPGKEKLGRHRDRSVNKRVALPKKETECVELTKEMKRIRKKEARSVIRQPLQPHCWPLPLALRNAILSSFYPTRNTEQEEKKKINTNQEFQMSFLLFFLSRETEPPR